MKTGCVFSLSLFPQMFLMERIHRSKAVLILSSSIVSSKTPINECSIRSAMDKIVHLSVPLATREKLPADKCQIVQTHPSGWWKGKMLSDIEQAYQGLKCAKEALEVADRCLKAADSEWLVDVLMAAFIELLNVLDWNDREILRGDTLQRKRYPDDSGFLLNLALEAEVTNLIVGYKQLKMLDKALFKKGEVALELQHWKLKNKSKVGDVDSILDVIARSGIEKAKARLV